MSARFLLTGYDAKRCQRRVHNEHDPTIEQVDWEPPEDLQKRFADGRAFEAAVFDRLRQSLPADRWRDLSQVQGKRAAIAATVAAMDDGVELILGGWLPDDTAGGRTGRPDLLLRLDAGGVPSYVPGDVKAHKTTQARKTGRLRYSTLADPASVHEADGLAPLGHDRIDDYLQLAHYWRMLNACGRAPTTHPPRGFIIGTDGLVDLDPSGYVLAWYDLDVPLFATFSRRQGRAKRSALERYDFEFGIRHEIASVASRRNGSVNDPDPVVNPIFTDECDYCPWYDYCLGVAGDAASAHIKSGRLSVREWRALNQLGVSTLDDLAGLNPADAEFREAYLPEVAHLGEKAIERLATAVRRAGMVLRGETLARQTEGPIDLPTADVEIDFDIEDAEGRVYLWGALVRDDDAEPVYLPTVSWEPLDEESERELALRFVQSIREIIARAEGRTVRAYHYSSHEISNLKRILGPNAISDLSDVFADLLPVMQKHYFAVAGHGLKKVAPAFGFHWRDEEPSGLLSQLWYLEAVSGDGPAAVTARVRILAYNEDDVRATAAVRSGIRH